MDSVQMTGRWRCRLTLGEWERFIAVWSPHFESLFADQLMGMQDYVCTEDRYDHSKNLEACLVTIRKDHMGDWHVSRSHPTTR